MSERPPFRADHVGSYLRPKSVIDARAQRAEGEIGPEALRQVEDEAIAEVVRQQEDVGLKGITDGEFRRFFFHTDFLEQLEGVTVSEGNFLARFHRLDGSEIEFSPPTMGVDRPIRHSHPIQGADFDYLASQVTKTPKVSIPAPSMLHFRGGRQGISEEVYPDLDQFFDDLTAAYREEIADLAAEGILVGNLFGGPGAMRRTTDARWVEPAASEGESPPASFEYRWEQRRYNAVNAHLDCRIHFTIENPHGTSAVIENAFVYDWRLWSLPEIIELLREAGFADAQVWRQTYDPAESRNSVFLGRVDRIENLDTWTAYVIGVR